MSGVDVRILLPHKSDSALTHWCTRSYVEELLEAGVKIYWYRKGINHSKVVIVDGLVASVGSANMDLRSFEQNFEVNMIIKVNIDNASMDDTRSPYRLNRCRDLFEG